MLGPSILFFGVPAAFLYSVHSIRLAPDRPFALSALALTLIETGALLFLFIWGWLT